MQCAVDAVIIHSAWNGVGNWCLAVFDYRRSRWLSLLSHSNTMPWRLFIAFRANCVEYNRFVKETVSVWNAYFIAFFKSATARFECRIGFNLLCICIEFASLFLSFNFCNLSFLSQSIVDWNFVGACVWADVMLYLFSGICRKWTEWSCYKLFALIIWRCNMIMQVLWLRCLHVGSWRSPTFTVSMFVCHERVFFNR